MRSSVRPVILALLALGVPACSARGGGGPLVDLDVAGADAGVMGGADAGFPGVDVVVPGVDVVFPSFDVPQVDRATPTVDLGFRTDVPPRIEAAVVSRTGVIAGRRCTSDDMCFSDTADLSCVPLPGGQVCSGSAGCEQGTVSNEESQCGGRYSTCLVFGNTTAGDQVSLCTRACVATAATEAAGACPSGSLCTTNWLQLNAGQTEAAGCLPFCVSDADCAGLVLGDAGAPRCNVRTGRCGAAPFDPSLRADGMPCNPQEVTSSMVPQCRGICFSLSATNRTQGLCGSFVNLRTSMTCADSETIQPRAPSGETMGICIFRDCENNAQCPAGLVCAFPEDTTTGIRTDLPSNCGYATTRQPNGIPAPGSDAGVPPG